MIQFVVPDELAPDRNIIVATPSSQRLVVLVSPGVLPGQLIQVEVPAASLIQVPAAAHAKAAERASPRKPPAARPRSCSPRPRPQLASPRVPCVQSGHQDLLEGRFAEAEPAYREALSRKEAALGLLNTSTISSLVSLAQLLAWQERHVEAAPLLERAVAAKKAIAGRAANRGGESLAAISARHADVLRKLEATCAR
jgi:hypothetical protein